MEMKFQLAKPSNLDKFGDLSIAKKRTPTESTFSKTIMRRFARNKAALVSSVVFLSMILMSIFAPLVAPYTPNDTIGYFEAAPSAEFLLGTDEVGRDILSRLIYGARISLLVGIGSVLIYVIIGTTLGLIAGFFGGKVDMAIMRITEVFMSFPYFMVILVMVSLIGPSVFTVTIIMGVLGWMPLCRLVRGSVLQMKNMDYVQAAVAVGYSKPKILLQQILPNVLSLILVNATFGVAHAILTEASLSFLGMGVTPPTASWGNMLSNAQSLTVISSQPWRWIPAGICVLMAVLSVNFIGDGLRDAIEGETK